MVQLIILIVVNRGINRNFHNMFGWKQKHLAKTLAILYLLHELFPCTLKEHR